MCLTCNSNTRIVNPRIPQALQSCQRFYSEEEAEPFDEAKIAELAEAHEREVQSKEEA